MSRFGQIRLGGADAKPDFSTGAWFAMLFSAGMGIGLMFWSVAEPVMHFESAPLSPESAAGSAQRAMDITFLHWGLHAWGIYALVGLALAYYSFNRGLPLTVRSAFYPFFGERIYGRVGDIIDILVQKRRDTNAAVRFFRKLKRGQRGPRRLLTDKLKSYPTVRRRVIRDVVYIIDRYANNRIEIPHESTRQRERFMQ